MRTDQAAPHLELLCYRNSSKDGSLHLQVNDVAATCLVVESTEHSGHPGTDRMSVRNLVDPDGHHLSIVPPAS